jgi:hypothetical protein
MHWRWCPRCLVRLYPIEAGDVCPPCRAEVDARAAFLAAPDTDAEKRPGICDGCGRWRNYRSHAGLCSDCGERAMLNWFLLLPLWGRESLERRMGSRRGRRPSTAA